VECRETEAAKAERTYLSEFTRANPKSRRLPNLTLGYFASGTHAVFSPAWRSISRDGLLSRSQSCSVSEHEGVCFLACEARRKEL